MLITLNLIYLPVVKILNNAILYQTSQVAWYLVKKVLVQTPFINCLTLEFSPDFIQLLISETFENADLAILDAE